LELFFRIKELSHSVEVLVLLTEKFMHLFSAQNEDFTIVRSATVALEDFFDHGEHLEDLVVFLVPCPVDSNNWLTSGRAHRDVVSCNHSALSDLCQVSEVVADLEKFFHAFSEVFVGNEELALDFISSRGRRMVGAEMVDLLVPVSRADCDAGSSVSS
jgi:transcriptional regulator of met regulon